ncbi:hypothetical protein PUN28_019989 [Cardiocondyla obscurior]|uniref:Uncharacterized protein n=1 Tax=Cardiocondyla obscurior TaxID=286306 RepID=A0AAW2EAC9_9HYME
MFSKTSIRTPKELEKYFTFILQNSESLLYKFNLLFNQLSSNLFQITFTIIIKV